MSSKASPPRIKPAAVKLNTDDFIAVIRNTPLVSIDLLIRDTDDNVLMGMRQNSPAKAFWFVPGGRILKDETIDDALLRIAVTEVGGSISTHLDRARFLGVFEHLYEDNFAEVPGFGTHYIVLAYEIRLTSPAMPFTGDGQHDQFKWFNVSELLSSGDVHRNVKNYFEKRGSRTNLL
jgi:colanic acid biosynthesis protein WcaH